MNLNLHDIKMNLFKQLNEKKTKNNTNDSF